MQSATESSSDHRRRPTSPISKTNFRPVDFQTKVELDRFFGQTSAQKRELQLHTRDENGRWWFDEMERDECRGLLSPLSPNSQCSPAISSRRGSAFNSAPCSPTAPYSTMANKSSSQLHPLIKRRSSMCLLGSFKPLDPVTPSSHTGLGGTSSYDLETLIQAQGRDTRMHNNRAAFTVGMGIVAPISRRASDHTKDSRASEQPIAHRTRAKRSHSATARSNTVGEIVPQFHFGQGDTIHMDDPFCSTPATAKEAIRLPAHLPLPHRLASSKELQEAFEPRPVQGVSQHKLPDNVGREVKRRRSILFASDSGEAPALQLRNRPRPAKLDLSPQSSFTTLAGMTNTPAVTSPNISPVTRSRVRTPKRRPQSARGSDFAQPFLSTVGGIAHASPSSGLADAFANALRGLKSPISPSPFANPSSAGLSASSTSSSNMQDHSPDSAPSPTRRKRRHLKSLSTDLSAMRRRLSWSLPSDKKAGDGNGTSEDLALDRLQQQPEHNYGSKSHTIFGMNPSNAHLLVPGGLGTGEEVYDGVVIECASIRLGSDDEDDEAAMAAKSTAKDKTLKKKASQWFKKGFIPSS
ncbi:unnamed protein product [Sympodiomycopsis kandeliae]